MHKNPPYDGARDFAPVALVAVQPLGLPQYAAGIPAANLREFIAYAEGEPERSRSTARREQAPADLCLRAVRRRRWVFR